MMMEDVPAQAEAYHNGGGDVSHVCVGRHQLKRGWQLATAWRCWGNASLCTTQCMSAYTHIQHVTSAHKFLELSETLYYPEQATDEEQVCTACTTGVSLRVRFISGSPLPLVCS